MKVPRMFRIRHLYLLVGTSDEGKKPYTRFFIHLITYCKKT